MQSGRKALKLFEEAAVPIFVKAEDCNKHQNLPLKLP
jgi:hypothetical protein